MDKTERLGMHAIEHMARIADEQDGAEWRWLVGGALRVAMILTRREIGEAVESVAENCWVARNFAQTVFDAVERGGKAKFMAIDWYKIPEGKRLLDDCGNAIGIKLRPRHQCRVGDAKTTLPAGKYSREELLLLARVMHAGADEF